MIVEKNKPRRRKGTGNITKRTDGRYLVRLTSDGQCLSKVCSSQKDAEKALKDFRKLLADNVPIRSTEHVSIAMERWLQTKKCSLKASSYDRLEQTFERIIKNSRVGRCQVGSLSTGDIQKLIDQTAEKYGYSSVKKARDFIHAFCKYQVAMRIIPYDPSDLVVMPSPQNCAVKMKVQPVFTSEELDRIKELMDKTFKTSGEPVYRHAALLVLLANTGLRIGEALALEWKDVDLDSEVKSIFIHRSVTAVKNRDETAETKMKILIGTVKTKNGVRKVPLNSTAVEALSWLRNYQMSHGLQSQFVDCNDSGGLLAQSDIPKINKRILTAANVPYRSVHTFRHTFATRLIESGADVKVVSQIMGHSTVGITYDLYVHPSLNVASNAVKVLEAQ